MHDALTVVKGGMILAFGLPALDDALAVVFLVAWMAQTARKGFYIELPAEAISALGLPV